MLLELEKDWETMLRLTSVSSRKSKIHIVEYIYTHIRISSSLSSHGKQFKSRRS